MTRISKGLGERHRKILDFLSSYSEKEGHPPSIREIGEACAISSTSVVNYYLDQLEKMGCIERDSRVSRGVRVTQKNYRDNSSLVKTYPEVQISPKVFISYAREDLSFAKNIFLLLKENNISPWLDHFNLLPGQDWETKIQSEIEASDYIIICLSRNSVTKRGYIQKEIRKALSVLERIPDGDIYIIPIRLDNCEVPVSLMTKQWLDWNEINASKKLLKVFDFPNISSRFSKKNTSIKLQRASRLCILFIE